MFKWGVMESARNRDQAIVFKILQDLRKCEKELERIYNDAEKPEIEKIAESSRVTKRMVELETREKAPHKKKGRCCCQKPT